MNIKTIAVEGISGIGKSNLGHYLSLNFNKLNIPNRWFFELDNDNPLIPKNHDSRIICESTDLLKKYIKNNHYSNQINIFDGRLLMVNVNKSLNQGLSRAQIIESMMPIIDLINENNIFIIMFYTRDVEKSFKNTIEQRNCLEWYINEMKSSKYGENIPFITEKTVIENTKIQQDILMTLFDKITINKKLIDITNLDWDLKYNDIDKIFNFSKEESRVIKASEYTGTYDNKLTNEKYIIESQDNLLKCTSHPYQIYKPVEQIIKLEYIDNDTFVAKGHPIKLEFSRNSNNKIDGLYEQGINKKENFLGLIKDKFVKI